MKNKWHCLRSGQCCSVVGHVTMTLEEKELIEDRVGTDSLLQAPLVWEPHHDPRFVMLVGDPACPLLGVVDGQPACTIHDIRPYNCRRWGCYRSSIDQDYDVAAVQKRIYNDRDLYRQAKTLQRRAQRWAVTHGWTNDD